MKKMFAVLAMVVSMGVSAATSTVDVSKLTADQRAQIQQIVQQKAAEAPGATVDAVLTRVEQFGASAARGLVGFAKEIGSEANQFAQTPLGMIVAGFTVLHFFGSEITSLIVGILFSFLVAPIILVLFVRSFNMKEYTYEYKPFLWGAWQRKCVTNVESRDATEAEVFRTIVYGAMLVISTLIGITHFVI